MSSDHWLEVRRLVHECALAMSTLDLFVAKTAEPLSPQQQVEYDRLRDRVDRAVLAWVDHCALNERKRSA